MQSLCNLKSPCNPEGNRCTRGPGNIELAYRGTGGARWPFRAPIAIRIAVGFSIETDLGAIHNPNAISASISVRKGQGIENQGADFVHPLTQSKASLHNPLSTDKEHPFNPIHGVKIITLSCCNTPSTTHVQTIQSLAKGHTNQILAHTSHHYS